MIHIGLLESVTNLTVTPIDSTTVLIAWNPPFTLEGVPIIGYYITVTNTTSGNNKTKFVMDTTMLYSIDHPDPENNFTVTVVPVNDVGEGHHNAVKGIKFPPGKFVFCNQVLYLKCSYILYMGMCVYV